MLIGNLGADPEIRATRNGDRVASISLATSETWKDKAGAKQERTEWHRLQVWGKLVDVVEKYLSKGDRIFVRGSIRYGKYEDNEGVTRHTTDIKVFELKMLGSPSGGSSKAAPSRSLDEDFSNDSLAGEDDLPF
jgi:single-strand DNA-binding protein